ncbi:putative urea ABC transporter substrate-binding protein [Altericroceibacterium xinjiangense]|uniref:putative urea ABC transporter substrate-binding protein n=1 Tax=Altericroceibacterium xinjiangense TaxID=762261 RepID=UPI001F49CE65|nr:putative urea ABC transporter substrate-binding protein [Altericroceibacterium xinjiangense]
MRDFMRALRALITLVTAAVLLSACGQGSADEADGGKKEEFNVGWSIYAGWMPWAYAQQAGIVDKWASKYGIKINLVQVNDYVESINQYTAGQLDAVSATNMDALTIPAAAGVDTTALLIGDYSNGNDGVVLKNGTSVADLRGRTVNLVELSVSHYLLTRALDSAGMQLTDVKTVNTSDADMTAAFGTPEVTAVAAWNPQLSAIKAMPGATEVFNSSQIPNEILDLMIVNTEVLAANPELGKALAGIWYETLAIMQQDNEEGRAARAQMARLAGTTPENFESQLATTYLYHNPADAVAYNRSPEIVANTDRVRRFSFDKGLFGPGAQSVDAIGIQFPGQTLGNPDNVRLRFDPTYMEMAASGTL